jgi:segregation and condensation protein B
MNKIDQLEAFLFIKGEPQLKKDICSIIDVSFDELTEYFEQLKQKYTQGGICIIETETEYGFATSAIVAPFIEKVEKDERGGELSKASLETLAIILYKQGATRNEIDYIRGVNSSFILRNLYLRGLITKSDEKKTRGVKYTGTVDLLRFLGVTSASELPGYTQIETLLSDSVDEKENNSES